MVDQASFAQRKRGSGLLIEVETRNLGEISDLALFRVKTPEGKEFARFQEKDYLDHIAEQAFFNIGGLEDLERNWAKIQKDYGV